MKTIIKVDGMSCMHCVSAVKNAIDNLEGVTSAEVILDKKIAEVEYNDNIISIDNIISAIEEQGFDASL